MRMRMKTNVTRVCLKWIQINQNKKHTYDMRTQKIKMIVIQKFMLKIYYYYFHAWYLLYSLSHSLTCLLSHYCIHNTCLQTETLTKAYINLLFMLDFVLFCFDINIPLSEVIDWLTDLPTTMNERKQQIMILWLSVTGKKEAVWYVQVVNITPQYSTSHPCSQQSTSFDYKIKFTPTYTLVPLLYILLIPFWNTFDFIHTLFFSRDIPYIR